tara:strand:+ start:911 stop:2056 length:1146 start_codon:yes stop_codon:yes gene_type:complete
MCSINKDILNSLASQNILPDSKKISDYQDFFEFVNYSRIEGIVQNFLLKTKSSYSDDISLLIKTNNEIAKKRLVKTLQNINTGYKISKLFNENKIEYVFLKGFYLTNFLYESMQLRPINDVDILVRKKDFEQAKKLLLEKLKLNKSKQRFSNLKNHSRPFYSPDGLSRVELHFQIFDQHKSIKIENDIFKYKREIAFKDTLLPFLPRELNLLHVISHGTSDGIFDVGIQYLFDVINILNKDSVNTDRLCHYIDILDLKKEVALTSKILDNLEFLEYSEDYFLKNNTTPQEILKKSESLLFKLQPKNSMLEIFYKKKPENIIFDERSIKNRDFLKVMRLFFAKMRRFSLEHLILLFNILFKKDIKYLIKEKKEIYEFFNDNA